MTFLTFIQQLHESQLATSLRESLYAFPIVEGVHLLGLALSFGLILFIDLRLIGVFLRDVPVSNILHQLRFWVFGGFLVTFATGVLLFLAEAATIIHNPAFLLKVAVMVLAVINALVFEVKWGRRGVAWIDQPVLPAGARFAGWTSLSFWTIVTISGRLIPYYPG